MKYFEDYEPGSIETMGDYRVEKEEIIEFARRWDPQPYHTDEAAAEASLYRGLTASGCHTFAITSRIHHDKGDAAALTGLLGHDELRLPNPVRPGDRLTMTSEVIERRLSRSLPDVGIVTTSTKLENQRGEIVLSMKATFMVRTRPRS